MSSIQLLACFLMFSTWSRTRSQITSFWTQRMWNSRNRPIVPHMVKHAGFLWTKTHGWSSGHHASFSQGSWDAISNLVLEVVFKWLVCFIYFLLQFAMNLVWTKAWQTWEIYQREEGSVSCSIHSCSKTGICLFAWECQGLCFWHARWASLTWDHDVWVPQLCLKFCCEFS